MPKKSLNATINRSRNEKNDEHYTQLSDIENELKHYREHFKGKVVLCNCDDPRCSNLQGTKFHAVWIADGWENGALENSTSVYDAVWRYAIRMGTVERLDNVCKGMRIWAGM